MYFAPNVRDFGLVVCKAKLFKYSWVTRERVLCMCFGYVPIFIGGGEGLRVEQRGPVRGAKNPSVRDY